MTAPSPTERRVVVAVALGAALVPLNSTMVFVALPSILADFGTDLSSAGWIVTAYLIAVAALQTPAGKLGDRVGHRSVFLASLATFGVASVAAAVAPTLSTLLLFRVAQGVAVAGVFPNGWAMLRAAVPDERRASRFGMVGSIIAVGVAAGPPIAGVAVDAGGWRSVFVVSLVLAVPALLLALRLPAAQRSAPETGFDLGGAFGWCAVLSGAAFVLNLVGGDTPPVLVALGVVAVAAGGFALLRWELAHPDPVVQPRFFTRPAFAAANTAVGFSNLAFYIMLLTVPLILGARDGASGLSTGLVLAAAPLALMLLGPLGGRLADRLGRRRPAVIGMSLFAAGLAPLFVVGAGIGVPLLVAGLAVTGVGFALAGPAMQASALDAVAPSEAGSASGVYATSRYLGSILGSSILAAVADPTGRFVFGMIFVAALLAVASVYRLPRGRPALIPAP